MAKVGDYVHIYMMQDEPRYMDKEGYITHIDDMGQLHGTWGGCAIIPGVDNYAVLPDPKKSGN